MLSDGSAQATADTVLVCEFAVHAAWSCAQELQRDGTAVSFVHVTAECDDDDDEDGFRERCFDIADQTGTMRFISKCTGGALVRVHHVLAEHRSRAPMDTATDLLQAALRCPTAE